MNIKISEIKQYQKGIRGPIGKFLDKILIVIPYLAIKYNISANMVTIFALVLDLCAVWLMFQGWFFLAGVLVLLSYVGDISDGTVARYHNSKNPAVIKIKKGYGQFLDEVLGVIGFTSVVFALGYTTGYVWLGLAGMIAIFMMNLTTAEAKLAIPTKKSISDKLQNHRFKEKFQIGFTCDVQRTLISFAVITRSYLLLLLFVVLGTLLWLSKFWVYKNQ